MKRILICSTFLVLVKLGIAQNVELPRNEQGKYIYYEIVDAKSIAKDSLINRAKHFFNAFKKSVTLKSTIADTAYRAEGKFIITKTASVLAHPSGEVVYNLVAEIKNGRYRYWLTDFKFIPYQRDRYGNFVPATRFATELEKSPGKLNAAEWKSYISTTADQARKLGANLKRYMSEEQTQKPIAKKSISTEKW